VSEVPWRRCPRVPLATLLSFRSFFPVCVVARVVVGDIPVISVLATLIVLGTASVTSVTFFSLDKLRTLNECKRDAQYTCLRSPDRFFIFSLLYLSVLASSDP